MKGIWRVFEFPDFDVLVAKQYDNSDSKYTLEFSVCEQVGNTATVSLKFDTQESVNKAFDAQTSETVGAFAKYIFDSMDGHGIFDDGGPDEVEAVLRPAL